MSIDTTDMHAIHEVFRRVCSDAPRAFDDARRQDATLTAVGFFYETVLSFLHCHHGAEDALLWPLLSRRCPAEASMVTRMEAQHAAVNAALGRAELLLARWREDPAGDVQTELVSAIGVLGAELGTHLDDEEAHLLPLAADHLVLDEWEALPRHAMAHFPDEKKWVIQGLVRQHLTDRQLAHMTKNMPAPALEAWASTGSRAFAALMASMPSVGSDRRSA